VSVTGCASVIVPTERPRATDGVILAAEFTVSDPALDVLAL
jgi:hypothetical protein